MLFGVILQFAQFMLAVDCWVLRFNEEGDVLQSLRRAGCIIKYAAKAFRWVRHVS